MNTRLKSYPLNNSLSNTLATKNIVSYSDYLPFGQVMPGRHGDDNQYRYAFNGKEKTDEVSGEGKIYDYGFRIYNPRIGKFLSVAPLLNKYPELTPYQFSSNMPISCIDLDGLETFEVTIMPVGNDPKLKQINVIKTSNEIQATPTGMTVVYRYLDAAGNLLSTDAPVDNFKEGSAESYAMNRDYIDRGGINRGDVKKAMNVTKRVAGVKAPQDVSVNTFSDGSISKCFAVNAFQYDLNILFNTDKANIVVEELQRGTYQAAIDDIGKLLQLMTTPINYTSINGANGTLNLRNFQTVVNGETDSRPSNYKKTDDNPGGNPVQGKDRANSPMNMLKSGVPSLNETNSSTQVVNHTGDVRDADRNASVIFVPRR